MFLAVLSVVLLCSLLAGLRSGIYCGSAVEDDAMLVSLSRLAQQRQANICCRAQDFEKAATMRDRELELKSQIQAITSKAKEDATAEVESGEGGGPMVTEADIANIVAQWTGERRR